LRARLAAALLLLAGTPASAAFLDPGYGARPAGMGGAFTAVSDDVNAVLYNPAGAAHATSAQAAFTHGRPFTGLDDAKLNTNFFSALVPVSDAGAFGLAWSSLVAPVYQQNTVTALAATSLNRWMPALVPSITVGANLNALQHRFDLDERTAGDSVFSGGRSRAAWSYDVGVIMKPDPQLLPSLYLGAAGKALNQPDIGLKDVDAARREWLAGGAFIGKRWTFAADLSQRAGRLSWRAGAEAWFRDETLALRAGARSTAVSAGFSFLFNAGRNSRLFLDYAYEFPLVVEETAGTHRAAFGFLF
jgi:hypothetical protein